MQTWPFSCEGGFHRCPHLSGAGVWARLQIGIQGKLQVVLAELELQETTLQC